MSSSGDPRAEPLVIDAAQREPTGWFDLARGLAILAVVVVHETSATVGGRGAGDPATAAWWTANVLDFGVPLVRAGLPHGQRRAAAGPGEPTGRGTLPPPPRPGRDPARRVDGRLPRLPLALPRRRRASTQGQAARDVAAGTPFLQLYFLYVLVVLYLLTPFLRLVVRHATHRMQGAFAAVLLGLGALDQVLSSFLDVGGASAATRFLPYAGYFTLGWMLAENITLTRRQVRFAAAAFVGSVAATAGLVAATAIGIGWGSPGRYVYGYLSPTVVVMSVAALVLLRAWGLRNPPGSRYAPGRRTAALSALTFGVYLVHRSSSTR